MCSGLYIRRSVADPRCTRVTRSARIAAGINSIAESWRSAWLLCNSIGDQIPLASWYDSWTKHPTPVDQDRDARSERVDQRKCRSATGVVNGQVVTPREPRRYFVAMNTFVYTCIDRSIIAMLQEMQLALDCNTADHRSDCDVHHAYHPVRGPPIVRILNGEAARQGHGSQQKQAHWRFDVINADSGLYVLDYLFWNDRRFKAVRRQTTRLQ